MNACNRWFIIPARACQLVFVLALLTNAFRSQAAQTSSAPSLATIQAKLQEKVGDMYHLRGDVEVHYKNFILRADQADYNQQTGDVTVRGHVTLDGGPYDEHITADHGSYNVQSETGKFYKVAGTSGFRARARRAILTSSAPFSFTGKMVEKVGEDHYIIHSGTITSCELPHPKWRFAAYKIDVQVGKRALIYNSAFDVKGVPVFYFPYTRHSIEHLPRQSGFLTPNIGTSSVKGFMLGDAFYWAINRSMDATLGAQLWSSRGWAQRGEFRARPSDTSFVEATYFGVLDRGGPHHPEASGEDVGLVATDMFPWQVRGVASLEYLSSYAFRQTWSENYAQAINSEVNSAAFLTKNDDGYSFNLLASRYQNFQSPLRGDSVVVQQLPAFESSSSEHSLGDTRFYWSYDTSLGALSRSEPGFHTAGLTGRFDAQPELNYSFVSHGWSLRPEIALRDTFYTEEHQPGAALGAVEEENINRHALEGGVELRPPALHRIFDRTLFHRKLKHTIEPRIVYRYVTGINNFSQIIRFDERDILTDTNEVEFGLVNRLFAKRLLSHCKDETLPAASDAAVADEDEPVKSCADETPREIVSWEVGEKLYLDRNFGGALVPGESNVFTSTEDFTGIAFLTDPRRTSPVISRLRLTPNYSTSVDWDLDYDSKKGHISSSSVFLDYAIHNYHFGAGHTYLLTPGLIATPTPIPTPSVFNQYRLAAGYGNGGKRGFSAATTVGFDVQSNFIQYAAVQGTYNWDCCGFTTEFRRLALGPLRNENQFRFAFSLANIGMFGNLKKNQRLY